MDDRPRQRPETGNRYSDAVRTLSDIGLVNSLEYREKTLVNWDKADPDIIRVGMAVLQECRRRAFPMKIAEVFRSKARQAALKRQGRSFAAAGGSPHNYGMAFDIIHVKRGWDLADAEWHVVQSIVQECARKLNLQVRCGRDWDGDGDIHDQRLYDPAHFELADWRKRAGLE